MGYLEYNQKLESLQYYIKSKSAVNVNELSKKLEVSRRTVLRMINSLREQGVNIEFCKKRKCYVM